MGTNVKTCKAYKVVRLDPAVDRIKYMSSYAKGGFALEYKIGETTFPTIGKIFVFKSLKKAKRHVISMKFSCRRKNDFSEFFVIEGVAENASSIKRFSTCDRHYEDFWNKKAAKKRFLSLPRMKLYTGLLSVTHSLRKALYFREIRNRTTQGRCREHEG
jgi:hypothetical protein